MAPGTRVRVAQLIADIRPYFNTISEVVNARREGAEGEVLGGVSGANILTHLYVKHDDEEGAMACYHVDELQEAPRSRFERV